MTTRPSSEGSDFQDSPVDVQKGHTKMLLSAAMNNASEEHNPTVEKALATVTAHRNNIRKVVTSNGGWEPGLLRGIVTQRDYDEVRKKFPGDFTADLIEELDDALLQCLDKGIQQGPAMRAYEEYVEQQQKEVSELVGVDYTNPGGDDGE